MPLTQPAEKQEARDRASPGAHIVYEAIRSEGETELQRPNRQLFWSGLAAGLSMGFSLLTEALLQASLPESPSKHLLVKLGYSVGFLVVILGRQQLFTENSLTPVLPVLRDRPKGGVVQILRLWLVVLVANLLGAFLFAWCLVRLPVVDESTLKAAVEVSSYVGSGSFWDNFFRSTIAGWLIALLVWLMPFAETGRIWVIIALTYIIGIGEFPHIIAGSVKAFMLMVGGNANFYELFDAAFLPVLLGNVAGGFAMVTLINHAQVARS